MRAAATALAFLLVSQPALAASPCEQFYTRNRTDDRDDNDGPPPDCDGTTGPTDKIAKMRKDQLELKASQARVQEAQEKLEHAEEACTILRRRDAQEASEILASCDLRAGTCEARVKEMTDDSGPGWGTVVGVGGAALVVGVIAGVLIVALK